MEDSKDYYNPLNLSRDLLCWETMNCTNFNFSGVGGMFDYRFVTIINQLDLNLVPVICCVGILGNSVSFIVLMCTYLRRTSASIYLAALSLADLCFLVAVFLSWEPEVQVTLYHKQGWCQFTVFLKYVSYFLSVWYIVSFTAERYIAVHFPLRRNQLCTSKRAKMVVVTLVAVGCFLYTLALWWYGVKEVHPGISLCVPRDGYTYLVNYLHNIDTVITLLVPFSLIAVMNIRIAHKVLKFYRQRKTMTMNGQLNIPNSKRSTSSGGSCPASRPRQSGRSNHVPHSSGNGGHHSGGQPRSQLRVTKMLLIISTAFLVMHMPRHTARIYTFIQEMRDSEYRPSLNFILWGKLFTYLYYLNFALNLFLYSVCGRSFRKAAIWLKNKIVHRFRDRIQRLTLPRGYNNPRYGNGSHPPPRMHLVIALDEKRLGGILGGGTADGWHNVAVGPAVDQAKCNGRVGGSGGVSGSGGGTSGSGGSVKKQHGNSR